MNIDGTVGDKYQLPVKTRPFDFGTDAIERQRVSLGQSLIDADFEYGLQATKWQTYQELRRFPSFYETPGTDFTFSNIVSGGETVSSNITVYFSNNAASFPPPIGTVLSVQGLSNATKDANRAEGFFLVVSNVLTAAALGNTCNYIAKGLVTASNVQTAYSVIRKGGVFANNTMKVTCAAITAAASNVTITTTNAHGLAPGTPLAANSSGASFNGNFFVSNILSSNSFNVGTVGTLTVASAANSNIYMNPYSYAVHRPFDGGVLLSPAQPSYGAGIIRQSKKVFRYQSGKGLLWSSGTLFCPNNDIASINVSGLTTGSNITVVSSVPNGLPQAGATIIIKGVSTANVNGTYTVSSIVESTTANVVSTNPISTLNPVLGDQPRFIMSNWHGASVRAGCFDDQNGLFWEYDGQTLFVVRRSSTFQLAGTVTTSVGSQLLTGSLSATQGSWVNPNPISVSIGDTSTVVGVNSHTLTVGMYIANLTGGTLASLGACWVISTTPTTVTLGFLPATVAASASSGTAGGTFVTPTTRFQDQLKVNDKIVIRGMTHQITSIQGQGLLTFNPPYRGVSNITTATPVQACKIKEIRVAQGQFNRDPLDGSGASGFRIDLTKMQMIGLQYSWYGAGFVDFMVRGADGNWVYAHRMRNNNVNDEAYMRTGNMPVRYELVNECQSAVSSLNGDITAATTTLVVNEPTTYFPSAGTLMIDNELISYSAKTSNTFTVASRGALLNYNVNDQVFGFTGQPASTHLSNTTVNLISLTCTPSLTHWGSALLMDGNFDSDRGYFFNYANTAVTVAGSVGASALAFLIRLCPSVSNGIVGDIGNRDLLNRAQLLLQKLEVTSANNVNVTGILNPTGLTIDSTRWVNVNSPGNGSQPSFAQIYTGATGTAGPGERIFSTIVQAANQNNLDLTGLKEMANSVIGGNQIYPDGPDVLAIILTNLTASATAPQVNLFWTEAQA